MPLRKGEAVIRPDEAFEYADFPEGGLASIASDTGEGRRAEVGLFGRESMVSTALVLGVDRTSHETSTQGEGTYVRACALTARAPGLPRGHGRSS